LLLDVSLDVGSVLLVLFLNNRGKILLISISLIYICTHIIYSH
jgi:hypothetical protein